LLSFSGKGVSKLKRWICW